MIFCWDCSNAPRHRKPVIIGSTTYSHIHVRASVLAWCNCNNKATSTKSTFNVSSGRISTSKPILVKRARILHRECIQQLACCGEHLLFTFFVVLQWYPGAPRRTGDTILLRHAQHSIQGLYAGFTGTIGLVNGLTVGLDWAECPEATQCQSVKTLRRQDVKTLRR